MCESNKQLEKGFATKAIHAGQDHKQWSNSEIVPPIVTTTTYYQEDPTLHVRPKQDDMFFRSFQGRKKKQNHINIRILFDFRE